MLSTLIAREASTFLRVAKERPKTVRMCGSERRSITRSQNAATATTTTFTTPPSPPLPPLPPLPPSPLRSPPLLLPLLPLPFLLYFCPPSAVPSAHTSLPSLSILLLQWRDKIVIGIVRKLGFSVVFLNETAAPQIERSPQELKILWLPVHDLSLAWTHMHRHPGPHFCEVSLMGFYPPCTTHTHIFTPCMHDTIMCTHKH